MYKSALILLSTIVFLGCDKPISECESKICTEQFVSAVMKFTKADGTAVAVKDLSVVNQRTGDTLKSASAAYTDLILGSYIIVDDNNLSDLSDKGDDLKVTATYEVTSQTKSAIINVSGGKCACHIHKISGPEKIVFD